MIVYLMVGGFYALIHGMVDYFSDADDPSSNADDQRAELLMKSILRVCLWPLFLALGAFSVFNGLA